MLKNGTAAPAFALRNDEGALVSLEELRDGKPLLLLFFRGAFCPTARKNLVMHCALRIGSALVMLSDGPGEGPLPPSGIVSVALDLDDADELRRIFDALSASGTVIERIIDAPWGALFAALRDRYGVSWMFNCTKKS